jgi:hypothetical protein
MGEMRRGGVGPHADSLGDLPGWNALRRPPRQQPEDRQAVRLTEGGEEMGWEAIHDDNNKTILEILK